MACSTDAFRSGDHVLLLSQSASCMQIGGRQKTPAYLLNTLKPGHTVEGPAILIDDISTVVVEPQCTAYITAGQDIRIEVLMWPPDSA